MPEERARPEQSGAVFATTHWSVVLAAGVSSPSGSDALNRLCGAYWPPIYAFLRRSGRSRAEAQDLTQSFLAKMLEGEGFAKAQREKGRFRSFLLASLKHFLADVRKHSQAAKRGGGTVTIPVEAFEAEEGFPFELPDYETPDKTFDRRWALALLELVLNRLEEEYALAEKRDLYAAMKPFLLGEADQTCARAAEALEMSEAAFKMAVTRMRQRYRQLLRIEAENTIASADEIDSELRQLVEGL